jgi:hypothetical protein
VVDWGLFLAYVESFEGYHAPMLSHLGLCWPISGLGFPTLGANGDLVGVLFWDCVGSMLGHFGL